MSTVAGSVMMLEDILRIEMVGPPRGRVQRRQGVMIVHGQRASRRHKALHRVTLGRDRGGPNSVQVIGVTEGIGGACVRSGTFALIPGL